MVGALQSLQIVSLWIPDARICLRRFYGVMAVYATPDLAFGSVISGFFYSFWNLFAGFLIGVNVSTLSVSWKPT
jgi:hypothetical protein